MKKSPQNSERDVIKYFLGRVLIAFTSLILISLLTYNLSPELYGKYALMMGLVNAVLSLGIGWIGSSGARYYEAYHNVSDKYLANILLLYFGMTFIIVGVLMVLTHGLNLVDVSGYFFYLIIITILMAFILIFENILRAGQFSGLHLIIFVSQYIFQLIGYYILSREDKSLTPLFVAMILSNFSVVLVLIIKFRVYKLSFREMSIPGLKLKLWRYGWPMLGLWGLGWILNLSDRFIIRLYYSELEVGLYDVTYKMVFGLLTMIITPFTMAVFPVLIVLWNKGKIDKVKNELSNAISSFLFFIIPAGVGLMLIRDSVYGSLISSTYENGKSIMIYIIIGITMNGLTQLFLKLWKLEEATLKILKYTIISVIFNIVLNFVLIPSHGNNGAAIATMISFSITTIIVFYKVQLTYKIYINRKKITKIITGSILMAIIVKIEVMFLKEGIFAVFIEVLSGIVVYTSVMYMLGELRNELKRFSHKVR